METFDKEKVKKDIAEIKEYYEEMEEFCTSLFGELKGLRNDNKSVLDYVRSVEKKLEEIEDTATFFSGKA